MVFEPGVLDYIDGDNMPFEREPVERLTAEGQLMAYRHEGFWQPMDTIREKEILESLWQSGKAPWRLWEATTTPAIEDITEKRAKKSGIRSHV